MANLTDREKLAVLIQKTFDEQYTKRGLLTAYHTAEYLIAHGVTMKGLQKPLTVTEAKNIAFRNTDKPPVVWVEFKKCGKRSRYVYVETVGELYRFSQMLSDYGNDVRCWAEKPTVEERQAAEWE